MPGALPVIPRSGPSGTTAHPEKARRRITKRSQIRRRGPGWFGFYPVVALLAGIAAIVWGSVTDSVYKPFHGVVQTAGISTIQDFTTSAFSDLPLQTGGMAMTGYPGWLLNGSAGVTNGYGYVTRGALTVGVRVPTRDFRGYFLSTQGSSPASCLFHAWATSPPGLPFAAPSSDPFAVPTTTTLPARGAPPPVPPVAELVFAVQTASTFQTELINYALFADNVTTTSRTWQAGFAQGRQSNATTNLLSLSPAPAGEATGGGGLPLHIVIATNGSNYLMEMVNGVTLLDTRSLHMDIPPPFQPYLEVQAQGTPYSVAFTQYAAICGDTITIDGLPTGSTLHVASGTYAAHNGSAVIPRSAVLGPLDTTMSVVLAHGGTRTISRHVLLPGNTYRVNF